MRRFCGRAGFYRSLRGCFVLAGKMEGGEGGPGCVAAEQIYFSIRVFDPYYDPAATSAARMLYLQGCATEHLGQKEAVNAIYGTWFSGP